LRFYVYHAQPGLTYHRVKALLTPCRSMALRIREKVIQINRVKVSKRELKRFREIMSPHIDR